MKEKQTLDAVAFTRKRRAGLPHAYAGLSAEQIEENLQQTPKEDPLWERHRRPRASSSSKKVAGCPSYRLSSVYKPLKGLPVCGVPRITVVDLRQSEVEEWVTCMKGESDEHGQISKRCQTVVKSAQELCGR